MSNNHLIYNTQKQTQLGYICTELLTTQEIASNINTEINKDVTITTIQTLGHQIKNYSFTPTILDLPNNMSVDNIFCWFWAINKINDIDEKLYIKTFLKNPSPITEFGPESGENLDAILIEDNSNNTLHIGTEDQDAILNSEYIPERYAKFLNYEYNEKDALTLFTKYIDFGFLTIVPILFKEEKIYFHFIVAEKKKTNDKDISTWFAVDYPKKLLIKQLSIQ